MGSTVPASRVNEYLVKGLYQDLAVECLVTTQVIIRQDSVVGSDDGSAIMVAPADINVDITVSGKNGLDTGSPADGWYELYMIKNPSTEEVAGLLGEPAWCRGPVRPGRGTEQQGRVLRGRRGEHAAPAPLGLSQTAGRAAGPLPPAAVGAGRPPGDNNVTGRASQGAARRACRELQRANRWPVPDH